MGVSLVGMEQQSSCLWLFEHGDVHLFLDTALLAEKVTSISPNPISVQNELGEQKSIIQIGLDTLGILLL